MAKGLAALARRAAHARQALVLRGGGGGPLARPEPPRAPLAEQDELTWDDGTAHPEPALDQFTMVSRGAAAAWLAGGLAFFGALGVAVAASDPESRRPFALKSPAVPPEVARA